ncbi:MAG: cob(I)yrinic acid a,c-diamide adenosyltransferase [Oscillospiraceae bacterium]|nr:cob(I)yrinic acid a,c-diamide adenosyltransferase [Oscillospiraceae bacterium]
MTGLIHLYYGEGKGKTTCAMGLALRAAGRDMPVVVAQFLKSDQTGERAALRRLPSVLLLPLPGQVTFTFQMTPAERIQAQKESADRLQEAFRLANERGGLLVLDEICAAITAGMVELEQVTALLDGRRADLEVVLTGRDPAQALLERADYLTEFVKRRHPYDRGVTAREGIEY